MHEAGEVPDPRDVRVARPKAENTTAPASSSPVSLLSRLRHRGPRPVLTAPVAETGPVTHEVLDRLPQPQPVRCLRAALVSTGVLPERDELLIRFEQWIHRVVEGGQDPADGQVVKAFTAWFHLRRLRRRTLSTASPDHRRPLQLHEVRDPGAIRLLAWLRRRGATPATCTQSDSEQWPSSQESGSYAIRNFVVRALRHGHAHNITAPAHTRRTTALMGLAGELPAVVLGDLLGIHISTATVWSQEPGNTRPGYAAEVAWREPGKN